MSLTVSSVGGFVQAAKVSVLVWVLLFLLMQGSYKGGQSMEEPIGGVLQLIFLPQSAGCLSNGKKGLRCVKLRLPLPRCSHLLLGQAELGTSL